MYFSDDHWRCKAPPCPPVYATYNNKGLSYLPSVPLHERKARDVYLELFQTPGNTVWYKINEIRALNQRDFLPWWWRKSGSPTTEKSYTKFSACLSCERVLLVDLLYTSRVFSRCSVFPPGPSLCFGHSRKLIHLLCTAPLMIYSHCAI